MNSKEIYQTKRSLITYTEKLTKGLSKPRQKLYSDILYGMAKSQSPLLSDIARALEDDIDLIYTIKCLSRNTFSSKDLNDLHQNDLNTLHPSIPNNPLIIG